MPRRARVVWPGYLYHVTQRGNNRQFIFHEDNDYIFYLKYMEVYRKKHKVDIYAYCLMGNHVHFIVKPHNKDSLARMFRSVNMRYAQYYQRKVLSCGHVFQGRYYSCLLQGNHIKEAVRYVELNPVRAKMVDLAWNYAWSSARAHIGRRYKWITLSDLSEIIEMHNWRNYLQGIEDSDFLKTLRDKTKRNIAFGSEQFIIKLEKILNRKIRPNPMGRPRITVRK